MYTGFKIDKNRSECDSHNRSYMEKNKYSLTLNESRKCLTLLGYSLNNKYWSLLTVSNLLEE